MDKTEMAYFADAWVERLREELPPKVAVRQPHKGTIETTGKGRLEGSSSFGWLALFLRLPLPKRVLVQGFFENALDDLQSRMRDASGTAWPAEGARRRVRVQQGQVFLEYVDDSGAVVHALRPVRYEPRA